MGENDPLSSIASAMVGIAWRVIVGALAVYFLSKGIGEAYRYGHGLLYEHARDPMPGVEMSFEILPGEDFSALGEKLERQGLLDNDRSFALQARLYEAKFEPGVYQLNSSMTVLDMINHLSEEGKKMSELKDRKLLDQNADELTDLNVESEPETDEYGAEIVGGGNE